MPKKLNTNPKAEEARQRKDAVKKEKKATEVKQTEDAKWADEGQSAAERRAAEREKKRIEELKKKEVKKAAAARDEEEIKAVKTVKVNPHKVTIAQIQSTAAVRDRERDRQREEEERRKQKLLPSHEDLLTQNPNQLERQQREEDERQYGKGGVVSASSLEEAVQALSIAEAGAGGDADRHPERRLRAAYREYEEAHWEELKRDNPSLRHSQLKDLLFKQWQKAPENPMVQAAVREREKERDAPRSAQEAEAE